MTITVRPTPNPNSLMFRLAGGRVLASGMIAAHSAAEAAGTPLAGALFALPGVASVLAVPDFVTVTKLPDAPWADLPERVEAVLREHALPEGPVA